MGKYDLNSLLGDLKKSEKETTNQSSDFWKPTLEKGDERAEYVIRFLPNPDSKTNFPWVERAAHLFSFASGKFIYEPCTQKVKKEKCYICEEVAKMYQSGDPSQETMGAKRFSKKRVFHNVLIVKDPRENGKNEGKVMIYECGSQIHDKCIEFIQNEDIAPEERIYFHPTKGTNFKMVITWKSNFQNYEKSDFVRSSTPLTVDGEDLNDDAAEQFIEENCIKLEERLLSDKAFKSYDKLKELYINQGNVTTSKTEDDDGEEEIDEKIDETIKEDKVEARNPTEKLDVDAETTEREDEMDSVTDDDDSDDEDAELAAILGD